MKISDITVIGLGALGTALVKTLRKSGSNVKSIFNRTSSKSEALADELNIPVFGSFPSETDDLGDLVFLTVTDSSISKVAGKLSNLSDDFSGRIVVHCSGNEPSEILSCLSDKGSSTAAFHPIQTFNRSSGPADFRNIYFSIEGDKKAKKKLIEICKSFDSNWIEVSVKEKSYIHASAVMASNYLVTLADAASSIGSLGNLKEKDLIKALLPLMQTTLQNVAASTSVEALSGPIARGDVQTVKKHLELLKTDHELFNLYKMLGIHTLKIAEKRGSLDETTTASLRSLLTE